MRLHSLAVVCGLVFTLTMLARADEAAPIAKHTAWVADLAFDKEGKLLATAGGQTLLYRPGEVKLWSPQDGKLLASPTGHETAVWGVAISSDGKTLATAGYDGLIRLWDLPEGKPRGELKGHKNWVTDLAFVSDTATLV